MREKEKNVEIVDDNEKKEGKMMVLREENK